MKALRVALAIVAALFVQTTLSPLLGRAAIGVDLGLVVVVFTGLLMGPSAGLLTGSVTGLVQDAIASGIVGLSGLSKTLVGFGAGVFGTMFIVTRPVPRFVGFFLASLRSEERGDKMSSVLDIQYKKPTKFEASASLSLLGASAYVGTANKRFTQMH